MGTLFIVATPIGNLNDLTLRALRTLKEADFILSEDTRITKKLLAHYQLAKPILRYQEHSDLKKVDYIIKLLKEGKSLALVSDAGTPGISDPGARLIAKVYALGFKVVPIPGPSALIAAASIAGFPMDKFIFMGFPPVKRKRKNFFKEITYSKYPVIFYESPHRIIKTLEELKAGFQSSNRGFQVVVCRELTKKFETIYRGTIEEVLEKLKKDTIKGEFTIIIGKKYEKILHYN